MIIYSRPSPRLPVYLKKKPSRMETYLLHCLGSSVILALNPNKGGLEQLVTNFNSCRL